MKECKFTCNTWKTFEINVLEFHETSGYMTMIIVGVFLVSGIFRMLNFGC